VPRNSKTAATPFDPTSEQIAIAAALRSGDVADDLLRRIRADDLYGDRHRVLWSVLRELRANGLEYDVPTFARIATELDYAPREFGGEDYLVDLVDAYPDDENVEFHVDRAIRSARLSIAADGPGEELLAELRRPAPDPSVAASIARELLSTVSAVGSGKGRNDVSAGDSARDEWEATMARRISGSVDFVATGLKQLDEELTWGWWPGKVSVLAGRPSNGKSAFASNLERWWVDRCERGEYDDPRPVLVVPLEPGNATARDGILASATEIDVSRIVKDATTLTIAERMRLAAAAERYVYGP